jgi:hypothetical protein
VPHRSSGHSGLSGLPDDGERQSAYTQAQRSTGAKGLSLHTVEILHGFQRLQVHAGEVLDDQIHARSQEHVRRLLGLALVTVVMRLAILIVLMNRV